MRLNLANPRAVFPCFLLFGVEILIVIYISHNAETHSFLKIKLLKTLSSRNIIKWLTDSKPL